MGLVLTAVEPLRRQHRARMRRRPKRRVLLAAFDAASRMIQVHASAAICMHRTPPRRGLRHVSSSKTCAPMAPTDLAPLIHHIYVLGPAVFCAEELFSCQPARRTQCPSTDFSADTSPPTEALTSPRPPVCSCQAISRHCFCSISMRNSTRTRTQARKQLTESTRTLSRGSVIRNRRGGEEGKLQPGQGKGHDKVVGGRRGL